MVEILTELSETELKKELRVWKASLTCPNCGAPIPEELIKELKGFCPYDCSYCGEPSFLQLPDYAQPDQLIKKESREQISYYKVKVMADLQIKNATMSSRMDVRYDPAQFIERKDVDNVFHQFLNENLQKFLDKLVSKNKYENNQKPIFI